MLLMIQGHIQPQSKVIYNAFKNTLFSVLNHPRSTFVTVRAQGCSMLTSEVQQLEFGSFLRTSAHSAAAGVCACRESAFTVGFLGPCGPPSIVGDIYRPVFQESPERFAPCSDIVVHNRRLVRWSTAKQR